jgi:hypothetical protein
MEIFFRKMFWCQKKNSRLKKCENSSQNSEKKKPTNLAQCFFLAIYHQMAIGFLKWRNLSLFRTLNFIIIIIIFYLFLKKPLKILPDSILSSQEVAKNFCFIFCIAKSG